MKLLVFSGLLGLVGAFCLIPARFEANAHAAVAPPDEFRLMAAGCWIGVMTGVAGALAAVLARRRVARKELSTLTIALCLGLAALSVLTRYTTLPKFVGFPMRVTPAIANPQPSPWMEAAARLGSLSVPASEFTPAEWQDFTNLFAEKIVPAIQNWCSIYGSHAPFRPDAVSPKDLTSRLGNRPRPYSYSFEFGDIRLSADETEHGSIYIGAITALTSRPVSTSTQLIAMDEIVKLIKADSGREYPTNHLLIVQPPNGDVDVYAGAGINSKAYGPPIDFAIVFGPDGKITHYGRGWTDGAEQ